MVPFSVRPRRSARAGDVRVLNRELVAAGMAWHYVRYSDDETLAEAERQARKARVGIWSEPEPVAPWRYRAAGR